MIVLTVDETIRTALRQATGPAEIRDEEGNLLGIFNPTAPMRTRRTTEADLPALDALRARTAAGEGKSLRQIFQHLKTLTDDPNERAKLDRDIAQLPEAP